MNAIPVNSKRIKTTPEAMAKHLGRENLEAWSELIDNIIMFDLKVFGKFNKVEFETLMKVENAISLKLL